MDSENVVEMLLTILIQGVPYFVIFLHAMISLKHCPKVATRVLKLILRGCYSKATTFYRTY
jgi:hypothetical protein